jgi:hypothetical protein
MICTVLCCAVLCCAVLCCAVLCESRFYPRVRLLCSIRLDNSVVLLFSVRVSGDQGRYAMVRLCISRALTPEDRIAKSSVCCVALLCLALPIDFLRVASKLNDEDYRDENIGVAKQETNNSRARLRLIGSSKRGLTHAKPSAQRNGQVALHTRL